MCVWSKTVWEAFYGAQWRFSQESLSLGETLVETYWSSMSITLSSGRAALHSVQHSIMHSVVENGREGITILAYLTQADVLPHASEESAICMATTGTVKSPSRSSISRSRTSPTRSSPRTLSFSQRRSVRTLLQEQ